MRKHLPTTSAPCWPSEAEQQATHSRGVRALSARASPAPPPDATGTLFSL